MFRIFALLLLIGALIPATASAKVVINEVNCRGTDWVELANTSGTPADVSGWILTDDELPGPRRSHRYVFPAGRSVPANGVLTVDRARPGRRGLPFGVACGDDTIRLARSVRADTAVDDVRTRDLTAKDDTFGRYPTGTGRFRQTTATKGKANEPSRSSGVPRADNSWLFDPTVVHEMALTLPQASQDALAAAPTAYVPGTFSLTTPGATYGPYEVGVRLKGDSTFRTLAGKAAFKVKFNAVVKGQRFNGLKELTLNNLIGDPSMVHETIGYEAVRAMGLPAPRAGYAFVSVNGAAYGVYANVETIDDVMLDRWPAWFSSTQHLYEGATGADATPERADDLTVDEGDPADLRDLQALVGTLATPSAPYSQRMAPVADLMQLTYFWAVEKYIGQPDGYTQGRPNNFFLHSDRSGDFRMLPWGLDRAFTQRLPYGPTEGRGGRLFNACLEDQACKERYLRAVGDVRRTLGGMRLENRLDRLAAVLAPWQARDPRREPPEPEDAGRLAETRAFLAERPSDHAWIRTADGQVIGDPGLPPQP
jgi:hypothetical protein